MSWPSAYGYKYTPIGLRQREVKDESGSKSISTTVHLPEGGHLLDIERKFNADGSVSKREASLNPSSGGVPSFAPPVRGVSPAPALPSYHQEPELRKPYSDLDRQAEDIIANFRARQHSGLETKKFEGYAGSSSMSSHISSFRESISSTQIKEEKTVKKSAQSRRAARAFLDEGI